jgi:hypothetical protein
MNLGETEAQNTFNWLRIESNGMVCEHDDEISGSKIAGNMSS